MKPLPIAALFLVGWYLMMPPIRFDPPVHTDFDAPLSKWDLDGSYDTATACEYELTQLLKRNPHPDMDTINRDQAARCIATDDPRLKGK